MSLILDGTNGVTFPVVAGGTSPVQASAGKVLQVVNFSTSSTTSTSSTSYTATAVTASITPSSTSSKILVTVNCADPYKSNTTSGGVNLQLWRGASSILTFATANAYTSASTQNNVGSIGTSYLDSPSTTSSVTYTIYLAAYTAGVTCAINSSGGSSTITLMEIAA